MAHAAFPASDKLTFLALRQIVEIHTGTALPQTINPINLTTAEALPAREACASGTHHRVGDCSIPFPLDSVRPSGGVAATQTGNISEPQQKPDAAKQFETMVVSFMLKDVVKSDLKNVLGEGAGGDFYLSVFTDAVARQIVEAGGIGIQQHIGPKAND